MDTKTANEITGGLSSPSKMPGKGFSLPPQHCPMGSIYNKIPGTICAACYARKGRYRFGNVQKKLDERYRKLMLVLEQRPGMAGPLEPLSVGQLWVQAMVKLIGPEPWFRWHDSGDLQNLWHLSLIVQVCQRTPYTRHWLPTKEGGLIAGWLALHRSFPPNLVVRVSAPFFDTVDRNWCATCTSSTHDKLPPIGFECPAYKQDGKCGECRACWYLEVPNVSYKRH